jgi:hypothetical protein
VIPNFDSSILHHITVFKKTAVTVLRIGKRHNTLRFKKISVLDEREREAVVCSGRM